MQMRRDPYRVALRDQYTLPIPALQATPMMSEKVEREGDNERPRPGEEHDKEWRRARHRDYEQPLQRGYPTSTLSIALE